MDDSLPHDGRERMAGLAFWRMGKWSSSIDSLLHSASFKPALVSRVLWLAAARLGHVRNCRLVGGDRGYSGGVHASLEASILVINSIYGVGDVRWRA